MSKKTKKGKSELKIFKILNVREMREHKVKAAVYIVIRTILVALIVFSAVNGNWENVMTCTLSFLLLMIPSFIENKLQIDLPNVMEVIMISFVFAANVMGELGAFYEKIPMWDTMLHTLNGFICAGVGFGLIDILNRNDRIKMSLSPLFVCLFSFCFSMTVGVIWEFFDCTMDQLFFLDMQKDTVVNTIGSIMLDSTGGNTPYVLKNITDVIVVQADGTQTALGLGGYLDIGLLDTMEDLFVNFIGALTFSIIGYFYVRSRGKNKFAKRFIPVANNSATPAEGPADKTES